MIEKSKTTDKKTDIKEEKPSLKQKKQDSSGSASSTYNRFMFLQKTIGNQVVQRFFARNIIKIGRKRGQLRKINDQKPNRIVGQVVHVSNPQLQRQAEEETRPYPYQKGIAEMHCDGNGKYGIIYHRRLSCGIHKCITEHEQSHIKDWKAKWPTGCKGRPKCYVPRGVPPDKPTMTRAEFNAFHRKSDCKAYKVSLKCVKRLPKTKNCRRRLKLFEYILKGRVRESCKPTKAKK